MYSHYFGFTELPFTIAPDPRYLYLSAQHREALANLLYGINCNGGFVLLTGDVGTGKTTVCRCLLEQLPASTEVAFILNPKYGITELLEAICDELKIDYQHSRNRIKGYIDALNAHLLAAHARGVNTVLIIDEAQNLGLDVLEQIRLLTNLETSSQKLLQIILIGQPELLDKLARPELRQLDQRITARYHLNALTRAELDAYVSHRLAVGGSDAPLFSRAALRRLHRLTRGVPRMVNILCDRALLGAFVERRNKVGWRIVNQAAREVLGSRPKPMPVWRMALFSLFLLVLLLAGFLYPGGRDIAALVRLPGQETPAPAATPAPVPEASVAPVAAPEVEPDLLVASLEPTAAGPAEGLTPASYEPMPSRSGPGDWHWPEGTDLAATEPMAYQALFRAWGIAYDPTTAPVVCRFARSHQLGCLLQPVDLDELLKLNQPAVVSLNNALGQRFFATLLRIDTQTGVATLEVAGENREVDLAELRVWLNDRQLVLWRLPPGYQAPLRPEASSPLVGWLDQRFAQLQKRPPRTLKGERYDEELQLLVLSFQHHYQLVTDAVVGPQTLIQLSALTEPDIPRLTATEPEWE